MRVAAHGNVDAYCKEHGFEIVERYEGNLEDYSGKCPILVTDNCADRNEYYYLKYKLFRRRIELLSTHWYNKGVEDFVAYMHRMDSERKRSPGRAPFGFKYVGGVLVEEPAGIEIARRIIALKDEGLTFRKIVEDEGVHHLDGRRMSISTVQVILKNRSKYE